MMVIESDPRLVTHSSPSLFGRTAIAAGTSIPCPATTVVMSSPREVVESEAQPVTVTSTKHQKTAGRTVIPPLRRRFRTLLAHVFTEQPSGRLLGDLRPCGSRVRTHAQRRRDG